ncbi:alpha-E domain-containing protein [Stratiformator vulcanicus]|uniref:DUF403 domain-containing protein n=1 Tax=Stratiformator vulcanicus TaxID=2527980 RepID=A0A517QXA2_9PLAN|nr:alpha-E domain-containing protein [Stratiformator vulcanicus]QDT36200.1 hypothetical protein Pan189_05550 [Stratiformator vulcanicus]
MLSRVADSIYWLSRYVERAENYSRFIDVNYNLALNEHGDETSNQWWPLIYTTGDQDLFRELHQEADRETVLQFLAFEKENPNSIVSCVASARENARSVRESIPTPLWEQINTFYLLVKSAARQDGPFTDPQSFCRSVRIASHTIIGQTYGTMSHNEAWHFNRIGRLLERADKTSRIVDVQYFHLLPSAADVGSSIDIVRWSALLRSADALTMYRKSHGRITPNEVAEFLLLDREFPRSFHFCLMNVQESMSEITGSKPGTFQCESEKLVGRLRTELDYTSVEDVVRIGLHEYIDSLQTRLNDIGGAIGDDFFSPQSRVTSSQFQSQG